ncbi:hypothetical protein NHQ30_010335 [Ciborinia camelliae]|nr:hypothetical protein NHQ30_010335 [Ciborinia camelliae]
MQFSTLLALSTSLALTHALPYSPPLETALLTFHGATPDAQYTLSVPLDGSVTTTHNALSISSISTSGFDVQQNCHIHAVDSTPTLVEGPVNTWVVGPPQTIVDVACTRAADKRGADGLTVVNIELDGAAGGAGDAKYFVNVPLGGGPVVTIRSTYPNIPACTFETVDSPPALVLIAPGVWNLGPPQTVKSVMCPA